MKRFLNELREITVQEISGEPHRYKVINPQPDDNELFIGVIDDSVIGLFIYKGSPLNKIYSLSFDDFSYNFLLDENDRLNYAFDNFESDITSLSGATVPDLKVDLDLSGD